MKMHPTNEFPFQLILIIMFHLEQDIHHPSQLGQQVAIHILEDICKILTLVAPQDHHWVANNML